MTSRERIKTALEGSAADRVPVSLYELTHLAEDSWYLDEPTYAPLLDMQRQGGDSFVMTDVPVAPLTNDPDAVSRESETVEESAVITTTLQTPKGGLTEVRRRDPSIATSWLIEPYLKTPDDVRKFLSIPVEPFEPDMSALESAVTRAGDEGMVLVNCGDPIGHVLGLFHYVGFLMMLMEHEGLVLELLRVTSERMRCGLGHVCRAVEQVAFRFWGPEYAAAPLVNPKVYFPKLVVDFTGPLVEMVNASGNYSVIHSHGRLDDILEMIADMNPHALEPLEVLPASTADVTMADVKRRIGDRLCLMGGIQANELENETPDYIEARVKDILDAAKPGGGFVLIPTSTPIGIPLDERIVRNYQAYFEAARKYGLYE